MKYVRDRRARRAVLLGLALFVAAQVALAAGVGLGWLPLRDPDHALMTASLAAHRAARCRAADELLSAASRRSPGVNVSANTVPGWSTCSAKSGMKRSGFSIMR